MGWCRGVVGWYGIAVEVVWGCPFPTASPRSQPAPQEVSQDPKLDRILSWNRLSWDIRLSKEWITRGIAEPFHSNAE